MDLKQRQVQEKKRDINFIPSYFHLKDVYFLSHYPVAAGRLRGTVNPKSLPGHHLATIYTRVMLRLKFILLGRLMSGSGRSSDLKDTGYHQGEVPFMQLVRAAKAAALLGNLVMHLLYKNKTCLCSVVV